MSNQVKHTAEPWHLGNGFLAIYDQYGWGVAGVTKHPRQVSGERTANARRIVACVNACRGLSTDELEKHGLVSAVGTELIELEKQRDQLLTALERMNKAYVCLLEAGRDRIVSLGGKCDPVDVMEKNDQHLRDSREAIAAAKGGAA